ncbi:hypothetical protein OIN60_10990 [Paenibacillus sp. P96]|uniref:Uncharacterized protein n=1 Tax=Paenibacillus zeirhizosphaerae TaxID=2987519 RepID=A0ABT9FRD6_9BACL|nr:hypothetical protein [Paenibacillus sp. P96]MDP4097297.1 hypothetical protein [Paenibacillus sp. P96]
MMNPKQPVRFRPFVRTRHAYQKLRICKRCGGFTALWEEQCSVCGRKTLVSVQDMAARKTARYFGKDLFIGIVIAVAAIYFSIPAKQTLLVSAISLVLLILLWLMQRHLKPYELRHQQRRLFKYRFEDIEDGLTRNRAEAVARRQSDELLCYEMLREIGVLLRDDRMKLQQIALLQSFVLRRDMDLILDALLLKSYEPLLVEYIGEIAKIKRELVKEKTLRYVTFYENRILDMPQGEQILISVASAAVRLKKYVVTYSNFIYKYVRKLPEDRFLRLHKMIMANPYEPFGDLADEVKDIYRMRYEHRNGIS